MWFARLKHYGEEHLFFGDDPILMPRQIPDRTSKSGFRSTPMLFPACTRLLYPEGISSMEGPRKDLSLAEIQKRYGPKMTDGGESP